MIKFISSYQLKFLGRGDFFFLISRTSGDFFLISRTSGDLTVVTHKLYLFSS
jgi:hypothetical protein